MLICSPTGTGKTLTAFLPIFSALAERRDRDELLARTFALYISPLRALGYDVEHNVRRPLREMGLLERPDSEPDRVRRGRLRGGFVRTGVRTGDTPAVERRLMLSRPPHILMTTPESLAIMLAMESYRTTLREVRYVVVDEVHALAGNKRGAQVSLLLESLEEIVRAPLQRIGLSATVAPLESVAEYLAGVERACAIVDTHAIREVTLEIEAPFAGAMAPLATIARSAHSAIERARSTLVFTNVRSQTERIAYELRSLAGDGGGSSIEAIDPDAAPRPSDARIGVHHSALERSVRHRTEARLRAGELRAVVCSASLELGVDIGAIERVLVVGGARGVVSTLQRVGRAGHRPGKLARGIVLAQDRDDIIEAAATRRCIADGAIEEIALPDAPLDVLAQWMVSCVVPEKRVAIDTLLRIARRAAPYRRLARADMLACAAYLGGGGVADDPAHVRRVGFDGEAIWGLGRDASAAFFENVGTIPDERSVPVRIAGERSFGRLEEDFVDRLRVGDVFVLEGRTLRVESIDRTGITTRAHRGRPTVPQWNSHIRGIGTPLVEEIDRLREGVERRLEAGERLDATAWLGRRYALAPQLAEKTVAYIEQQRAVSALPSPLRPVFEIYILDALESAVALTGIGRRANEALARVAATRIARIVTGAVTILTDDIGFLLQLPPRARLIDAQWERLLEEPGFERDLREGLLGSALLRTHFRYVANTGLLVLRRANGRALRSSSLRWNSGRILDRLMREDENFPLVRETFRSVCDEVLDAERARRYCGSLVAPPRILHPPVASPMSFGILTSSFGDNVAVADRSDMVEALHERVIAYLAGAIAP
uniref:Putative Uncharacterized ATP-dependent helicase MTH_1802 n=1 Tax=mine drainage metagenome TaxID=410659 RepID=E6Q400_9ZZZZ